MNIYLQHRQLNLCQDRVHSLISVLVAEFSAGSTFRFEDAHSNTRKDFGCRLKREMLYLLNRPEEAYKNVDIALKSEHINTLKNDILSPELYLEKLECYKMPDHSIKWINMPLYEGFYRH